MSRDNPKVPITLPLASRKGTLLVETQVSRPSGQVSFSSMPTIGSPVAIIFCSSASAADTYGHDTAPVAAGDLLRGWLGGKWHYAKYRQRVNVAVPRAGQAGGGAEYGQGAAGTGAAGRTRGSSGQCFQQSWPAGYRSREVRLVSPAGRGRLDRLRSPEPPPRCAATVMVDDDGGRSAR